MKDKFIDKIRGAMYGVAVGDALGAPLEFMDARTIQKKHGIVRDMIGGGWLNVKPGEVTDDTQMTLCVARGIVESPEAPVEAVGRHFIEWLKSGPKDVGNTCKIAIIAADRYKSWETGAKYAHEYTGEKSAGNGSLMRSVFPGLFYPDELTAASTAISISDMTHYDAEASRACCAYTMMIHKAVTDFIDTQDMIDCLPEGYNLAEMLEFNCIDPSGHVVNSFVCALRSIITSSTFEEAVIKAVNLGGDADTIGAITGGLAGAMYGYEAIPERWTACLSPVIREEIDHLAEAAAENMERTN